MLSFIAGAFKVYSSFLQWERGWHASVYKYGQLVSKGGGALVFRVDIILAKRLSKTSITDVFFKYYNLKQKFLLQTLNTHEPVNLRFNACWEESITHNAELHHHGKLHMCSAIPWYYYFHTVNRSFQWPAALSTRSYTHGCMTWGYHALSFRSLCRKWVIARIYDITHLRHNTCAAQIIIKNWLKVIYTKKWLLYIILHLQSIEYKSNIIIIIIIIICRFL